MGKKTTIVIQNFWIDINGTPHKEDIDDHILAAKQAENSYCILASIDGDMFNPLNTSNNINKQDRIRGGRYFRLCECSRDCYIYYVQFLRSRNYTHYLLALRRLNNE